MNDKESEEPMSALGSFLSSYLLSHHCQNYVTAAYD